MNARVLTVLGLGLGIGLLIPALASCGGGSTPEPARTPPTVTSVIPGTGFITGGAPVTIAGTDFADATDVGFDGAPAAGVTVVSATTITATTPPGASGPTQVTVTTPGGTGAADVFTYVTWPPTATSDLQIDDEGASEQARVMDDPVLCCDGPRIYVAWAERRAAAGGHDVFFQRSLDRGATWEPTDRMINTNGANVSDCRAPSICCTGSNIYVVWVDDRDGGPYVPYVNRSTDGGASFGAGDTRIAAGTPLNTISTWVGVCCDGDHVYAAWMDDRNVAFRSDIFVNSSTDGGMTWRPTDARVSSYAPGTAAAPTPPRVCCRGAMVAVTWSDWRSGTDGDVFFIRSTDAGTTWPAAETRLDHGAALRNAFDPVPRCSGPNLHVVWSDDRNAGAPGTGYDVYATSSTDGGTSFAPSDALVSRGTPGASSAFVPLVCCTGSTVHVVWQDDRSGTTGIYYNRSTDGGAAYEATDQRLDTGAGSASSARFCCGGGVVHATWMQTRTPPEYDVFVNSSADGGATWLAADIRLDTDVPGVGNSLNPRICCDGALPYVVWRDDRNATAPFAGWDAFFASYVP